MITTRNQSAVAATVVLCAAALLALFSFRQIAANINQPNDQLLLLKSGKHYWQLVDQSNHCVGNLNLDFQHSASSSILKGEAALQLSAPSGIIPISLSLEMNFNDLGQLGGGILRFSSKIITASIGSVNVAPVNVRIRHRMEGQEQRIYDFSIPGPIFIEPVAKDAFRLRYRFLDNLNLTQANWLNLPQLISLRDASADQICTESGLDTSTLLSRAQQLTQALPDFEQILQGLK